jgi:transposase
VGAATVTRGRGRPSKFPEVADRLVAMLADGMSVPDAADQLGIHRRTINYWVAAGRRGDPRFAELVDAARR